MVRSSADLKAVGFFVPGRAKTQGSMVVMGGRVRHERGGELAYWRYTVAGKARDAFGFCEDAAFTVAVAVRVEFVIERPKSVSASKRPLPVVKPDLDKLIRAIGDALTGIAWKDDGQVTAWIANKRYAEEGELAGAYIEIARADAAAGIPSTVVLDDWRTRA